MTEYNEFIKAINEGKKYAGGIRVQSPSTKTISQEFNKISADYVKALETMDSDKVSFFINSNLKALLNFMETLDIKSLKDGIDLYNTKDRSLNKVTSLIVKGLGK